MSLLLFWRTYSPEKRWLRNRLAVCLLEMWGNFTQDHSLICAANRNVNGSFVVCIKTLFFPLLFQDSNEEESLWTPCSSRITGTTPLTRNQSSYCYCSDMQLFILSTDTAELWDCLDYLSVRLNRPDLSLSKIRASYYCIVITAVQA